MSRHSLPPHTRRGVGSGPHSSQTRPWRVERVAQDPPLRLPVQRAPNGPGPAQRPDLHRVPVAADGPRVAVVVQHRDGADHRGGCTTRSEPEPEPEPGRRTHSPPTPAKPPPHPETRRAQAAAAPPGGDTAQRDRGGRRSRRTRAHTYAAWGANGRAGTPGPASRLAAGVTAADRHWLRLRPGSRPHALIGCGREAAGGSGRGRRLGPARRPRGSFRQLRLAAAANQIPPLSRSARCDWLRPLRY